MKALEIHLKSGVVITVDATDVSSKRNVLDDEFTSLEWVTPKGAKRKLHAINLGEIVALVVTS